MKILIRVIGKKVFTTCYSLPSKIFCMDFDIGMHFEVLVILFVHNFMALFTLESERISSKQL